jgi:hypothetical protein
MKILPVGDELFHADGKTDVTKLIVVFKNFANAPKNLRPRSNLLAHCSPHVPTSWTCLTLIFAQSRHHSTDLMTEIETVSETLRLFHFIHAL